MCKIFTFYGANSKVGVTMVCQSVGEFIAGQNLDKKILILHLDGTSGTEYTKKRDANIDSIKVRLISDVLTFQEFKEACYVNDNLYSLGGTDSLRDRALFEPSIVKKLFDLINSEFDVVIVDAGSGINMGLSIGSLLFADYKILVTTQQETSFKQYMMKKSQILSELEIGFNGVLINKFINAEGFKSVSAISSEYEIYNSLALPMSGYGWQAESENKSLLKYKEKNYLEGITNVSRLLKKQDIDININENEKKIFGFKFGRK